jgi:histone deacetylase complex regulatory component SIN3
VKSALHCKICLRSYRIFFVAGTEEYIYRDRSDAKSYKEDRAKVNQKKTKRFEKWLEGRKESLEQLTMADKGKAKEVTPMVDTVMVDAVVPVV